MSEPTKEQGDAAEDLARTFAKNYSWQFCLPPSALVNLIDHVRAQENNDALERAASYFDEMGPAYEMFCDSIADQIRAMKVPT